MFKILLKLNKKILKRWVFAVIALGLVIAYLIYVYSRPAELEVDFLNVGQGDAALIKTPYGQTILIDGGPDNRLLRRLGEKLPYYKRKIDFVLISHYHDDHVMGLVEVAKRFKIGQLIYASNLKSSPAIQELAKYISRNMDRPGVAPNFSVDKQASLSLGADCNLEFLNPVMLKIKSDDNNSLVAKLNCAGQSFLFTGDNSAAVEKALLKSDWKAQASVLKASHHGSNSANTEDFLRAVNPGLLVISVGLDNKFGHPHPKVIDRAGILSIPIKQTSQSGTITIFSVKKPMN